MPRLLLLLDFDSTVSLTSTLPCFLNIPTTMHSKSNPVSPDPPATASELANLYASDLASHVTDSPGCPLSVTTLSQEIARHNSLRLVEFASFCRGSGAFQSVQASNVDIHDAACQAVSTEKVTMRNGWLRLVTMGMGAGGQQQTDICILSVAWSPVWIRGLLDAAASQSQDGISFSDTQARETKGVIEGLQIECNDVLKRPDHEDDEVGESGIYVSADKLRKMSQLRGSASNTDHESSPWTVYIGDSLTDLECLLAANVGIIMRDEETMGSEQRALMESPTRFAIATYRIRSFGQIQTGQGMVLWWARDFDEIVDSGCLVMENKMVE